MKAEPIKPAPPVTNRLVVGRIKTLLGLLARGEWEGQFL